MSVDTQINIRLQRLLKTLDNIQVHIFLKIQPTTIGRIKFTLGKNQECSEREIKGHFELCSILRRPCIDSLFSLIYDFNFFESFVFWSYLPYRRQW